MILQANSVDTEENKEQIESHHLSKFEKLLAESPEECLCTIFAYAGFSAFLTLSSVSKACFDATFEMKLVWKYFGKEQNVCCFFAELDDRHGEQLGQNIPLQRSEVPVEGSISKYRSFKEILIIPTFNKNAQANDFRNQSYFFHDRATLQSLALYPSSLLGPQLNRRQLLPFISLPSRDFFACVGIEMRSWKIQSVVAESYQWLPPPKTFHDDSHKTRRDRRLEVREIESIRTLPSRLIDFRPYEVRGYLDQIIDLGNRLATSKLCPAFGSLSTSSTGKAIAGNSRATQHHLIDKIEPLSDSSDPPLMSVCNGRIYSADFSMGSGAVPELPLPVVPQFIGFYPKPLMQGACSQCLSSSGGVTETKGTSGRASVWAASWMSVYSDTGDSVSPTIMDGSVHSTRKRTKLHRTPNSLYETELQSSVLRDVFHDHIYFGPNFPPSHQGFLSVAYSTSTLWPNIVDKDEQARYERWLTRSSDSLYPTLNLTTVGILSVLKQSIKGTNKTVIRTRPESFAAFRLEDGDVVTCVDGTLRYMKSPHVSFSTLDRIKSTSSQKSGGRNSQSPGSESFSNRHVEFGFSSEGSNVLFAGVVAIGTSHGHVYCTKPYRHIRDDSERDQRVFAAWSDINTLFQEELSAASRTLNTPSETENTVLEFWGKRFQLLLDECVEAGTIYQSRLDAIVASHGLGSVGELYVHTLSDGIEYDHVTTVDITNEVSSLHVFGSTSWAPYKDAIKRDTLWILAMAKGLCVKLCRYFHVLEAWQPVHVIQGPILNVRLQPTTGILALISSLDSKLHFFSLKAYASLGESEARLRVIHSEIPNSSLEMVSTSEDAIRSIGAYITSSNPTLIRALNGGRWAAVVNKTIRIISLGPHARPGPISINPLNVLVGHRCRIYACEFDGVRRLGSISTDEVLVIWDLKQYRKLFHFSLYTAPPLLSKWSNIPSGVFEDDGCMTDGDRGETEKEDDLTEESLSDHDVHRTTPAKIDGSSAAQGFSGENASRESSIDLRSSVQFPSLVSSMSQPPTAVRELMRWSIIAGMHPLNLGTPPRRLPIGTSLSPAISRQWQLPEGVQIELAMEASRTDRAIQIQEDEDVREAIRRSLDPSADANESLVNELPAEVPTDDVKCEGEEDNVLFREAENLRHALLLAARRPGRSLEDGCLTHFEQLLQIEKQQIQMKEELDYLYAEELQKQLDDESPTLREGHREHPPALTGLLYRRPGTSQNNPQSREVAWLALTPRRLTILYKKKRKWQSWRF